MKCLSQKKTVGFSRKSVLKTLAFSFITFCLLFVHSSTWAIPTSGTNFWLCFPYAEPSAEQYIVLLLASNIATTATVLDPTAGTATYTITPGSTTAVTLLLADQMNPANDDTVTHLGIQVTSLDAISVYGINYIQFNTDGYLALPVNALGNSYIVVNYECEGSGFEVQSEFSIVGTQNATSVTITPSAAADSQTAGIPYVIALNQGDTYELGTTIIGDDLTGTLIQSNQPIAVFGDNAVAQVPTAYPSGNQLLEELWPVNDWGTNFVTLPLATRTGGDTFRFLASVNGTTVNVNGTVLPVLNQGQFAEQIIAAPGWITANNPIYVTQYSNSHSYDCGLGLVCMDADPFMITVPPTSQYGNNYLTSVLPPSFGFSPNYENLLVPTSAVGAVSLDGAAIPAASFVPIGASGYSGAAVSVSAAEHVLVGVAPFGALVYGFNTSDGYGYPAGSLVSSATATATVLPTSIPTSPCAIHVWPDPFNPQYAIGGTLKVGCLPPGATVSFYTVSGELVSQVNEAGGMAQWAGTNRQNLLVSSGIYFYVIQNGSNVLGRGKFLINR